MCSRRREKTSFVHLTDEDEAQPSSINVNTKKQNPDDKANGCLNLTEIQPTEIKYQISVKDEHQRA